MVLAHQDAWRKHPFLANCGKKPFTGLGTATAIFGVYLVVDALTGGSSHDHSSSHSSAPSHGGKVSYVREEVGAAPTLAD